MSSLEYEKLVEAFVLDRPGVLGKPQYIVKTATVNRCPDFLAADTMSKTFYLVEVSIDVKLKRQLEKMHDYNRDAVQITSLLNESFGFAGWEARPWLFVWRMTEPQLAGLLPMPRVTFLDDLVGPTAAVRAAAKKSFAS